MKIYAIGYDEEYEGVIFQEQMYVSREEAEKECERLNREEMKGEGCESYEEFLEDYDHFKIYEFGLK